MALMPEEKAREAAEEIASLDECSIGLRRGGVERPR